MPDSHHPAAQQPTPFGLNRYMLLIIYLGYTFASTYTYLGWGSLSSLLFRHDTFLWNCTPEEQTFAADFHNPICGAQNIAIQSLFTLTYATHFSVIAVAGFFTDIAGPKVTAMLGQALNICGWGILGATSDEFRAVLPAFLLIGAGAGMSYLPMLCIVNLFPGSTGFGLTILGAAASLGFAIAALLDTINRRGVSFQWVLWGYVLLGPAISMVIVILFVPLGGFIEVDRFVLVRQVMFSAESTVPPGTRQRRGKPLSAVLSNSPSAASSPVQPGDDDDPAVSSVTDEEFFQPFKKEACTFLYIGLCVYFMISSLVMNYFQKASSIFLSAESFMALETALPLSVIPCIILGRLTDFISVVWVMIFVNASGLLSYVLAIIHSGYGGMGSVAFFSIYISLFSSQVYIFVVNLFTSSHFGKLVGIVNLLGGLISLLSNYFYQQLTMEQNKGDPAPVMKGIIGAITFAFLILIPMAFLAKKKLGAIKAGQVLKENKEADGFVCKGSVAESPSLESRIESAPPAMPPHSGFSQEPAEAQRTENPNTANFGSSQEPPAGRVSDDRLSVSLPGIS